MDCVCVCVCEREREWGEWRQIFAEYLLTVQEVTQWDFSGKNGLGKISNE